MDATFPMIFSSLEAQAIREVLHDKAARLHTVTVARMHRILADKIMPETRLDGQEAYMIYNALLEQARRSSSINYVRFLQLLAGRVAAEKLAFHSRHYGRMAAQYDLPPEIK